MKLLGQITVHPGRDSSVSRHHPWLFSGAVAQRRGEVNEGALVEVISGSGEYLGAGFFSDGSIAVRMLAFAPTRLGNDWLSEALGSAIQVRERFGLLNSETTTAFRLVNAEGDFLPGLVVDFYAGTIVIQTHHMFMSERVGEIAEALNNRLGNVVQCILHRVETGADGCDTVSLLSGVEPVEQIRENGLLFKVDLLTGHKTGFYLDQRENRGLVRELSRNRRVLNAFCYSGGFSVAALAGGAESVTSVDSSKGALELLSANISLNGYDSRHTTLGEDYLSYMKSIEEDHYDLIVLDPPAFVKHRGALKGGITGYRAINANAMQRLPAGGLLLTFSCSQFVNRELFRETVLAAAGQVKREVRLLKSLFASTCHPQNIAHAEGEYLKGFLLRVN